MTMNSPSSASDEIFGSSSFERLDPLIQKWIWREGWAELKDAQEQAIPIILRKDRDVIIAAATASGKTEAAFLPVLTQLLSTEKLGTVLYVSPLKALINDQWGRLSRLCEELSIPVTPWHGDVSDGPKKKFFKDPKGIVLITPESLEALVMNRGGSLSTIFERLEYIVIDEAHAFIGSERGKQIQSLFSRVEKSLKRTIVRVALSATLGEMRLAAQFLRPSNPENVVIIESNDANAGLQVLVKGYVNAPQAVEDALQMSSEKEELPTRAESQLLADLFKATQGTHNLIFPNSRRDVERYTDQLNQLCVRKEVPREYWPHHGSLSRQSREETEQALKSHTVPATGICTTTMELGIDIGDVESVTQLGPPPSVASLRQRLGRSGRRAGKYSVLRCYAIENEITARSPLNDEFREKLLEHIAMIELLTRTWYEPPQSAGMHLSTMVQQLLSMIAQFGGLTIQRAWDLLMSDGVFTNITKAEFVELLKHLGTKKILMQDSSGVLLHGEIGEKLVNHYGFFASFSSEDEFRIVCEHKSLGSLPVDRPVENGSYILFGGRRWLVLNVNIEKKVIDVKASSGGRAPFFSGSGHLKRHDKVREMMRGVLHSNRPLSYLDEGASELLKEARKVYRRMRLDSVRLVNTSESLCLFAWKGDWVQDTLVLMLKTKGISAYNAGLFIEMRGLTSEELNEAVADLLENPPSSELLVEGVLEKHKEKWDSLLPANLLHKNYASHHLDLDGALAFLADFKNSG